MDTYKNKRIFGRRICDPVFKARAAVYRILHINSCSAALEFLSEVFSDRKVYLIFAVIRKESESANAKRTVSYVNNNRNTGKT